MNNVIPRVAAIHDMSGFGRCALTVIIPVMSTLGIQVCPMPTAIMSTHSGGFKDFSFVDLTDSMDKYMEHWETLDLKFDSIYSGFLGSAQQIDIVSRFIDHFDNGNTLVAVDPVMGDDGVLYKTYNLDMQNKMRHLVSKAHIITPNITEAAFLLEKEYENKPLPIETVKQMLKDLSLMGPDTVVITGIIIEEKGYCNIGYSKKENAIWLSKAESIPAHYPGTGDAYASVLIGNMIKGDSLSVSMAKATKFVYEAAKVTYSYKTPEREGILLEKVLPLLLKEEYSSCEKVI